MSREDREKWDRRYAEDSQRKTNPDSLLREWLPRLPVGKALDVACGLGRNALLLAAAGYRVEAIDVSAVGLERARREAERLGLDIDWVEQDLDEAYDFAADYDLIVVMWFVNLDLIARLCDCLAPGGYLLCEEHLVNDEAVAGPENPRFRVAPGALRDAVSRLEILHYEESVGVDTEGQPLASARVVARKP